MNFTKILERGIRSHIDKNVKVRKFAKCVSCQQFGLLINYVNSHKVSESWFLCEVCYGEMVKSEDKLEEIK